MNKEIKQVDVASITPAQQFNDEYEKLCKKHNLTIQATPAFVATNHQSFEIVIEYRVVKVK